jgi:hypothetical protein
MPRSLEVAGKKGSIRQAPGDVNPAAVYTPFFKLEPPGK